MLKFSSTSIAAISLIIVGTSFVPSSAKSDDDNHKGNFSFALVGDTAYNFVRIGEFDRVIEEINEDKSIKFVLHAGDVKGGEPCSDEVLQLRFDQFSQFNRPLIYTPGDNEWADCHSFDGDNPLDRLEKVRELFFPDPGVTMFGKMRVETQSDDPLFSEFVENVLWKKRKVVFGTVHVVGSRNDLVPWTGFDPLDTVANPRADRIAEFDRRMVANLAWIDHIFAVADQRNSAAIFIMIHANPRFGSTNPLSIAGFNPIIERLRTNSIDFNKPVVLAHGDSHLLVINNPLEADAVGEVEPRVLVNFTRLMTFGNPDTHWVKITVRSDGKERFFNFEPKIVETNKPVFE